MVPRSELTGVLNSCDTFPANSEMYRSRWRSRALMVPMAAASARASATRERLAGASATRAASEPAAIPCEASASDRKERERMRPALNASPTEGQWWLEAQSDRVSRLPVPKLLPSRMPAR